MRPTTVEIRERDPRLAAFSDSELRRELHAREQEQARAFFASLGPCPQCGAPIVGHTHDVVEEFKSAPKWQGWPAPPLPEYVQIDGWRFRNVLTCENGHETESEDVRFRNQAR